MCRKQASCLTVPSRTAATASGGHAELAEVSIMSSLHPGPRVRTSRRAVTFRSPDGLGALVGRLVREGFDEVTPNGGRAARPADTGDSE